MFRNLLPLFAYPAIDLLDLFQRAKTSVYSNQEQHSVTTIIDQIEPKEGKKNIN